MGILATVCFYHRLSFLEMVQTNWAAHILDLFIISQKLLVSYFVKFLRFRLQLSIRPSLRALYNNVKIPNTNRGVCRPVNMSVLHLLSLYRVFAYLADHRLFISEHLLLQRALQLVLGVLLKSSMFLIRCDFTSWL